MSKLTGQEIFSRIYNHYIVRHHTFSWDQIKETPEYEDEEGNKDPVAVLAPGKNKAYHQRSSWYEFVNRHITKDVILVDLVDRITTAHDAAASSAYATWFKGSVRTRDVYRHWRKTFRQFMKDIAKQYNFSIPSSRPYPTHVVSKKSVRSSKKK